MALMGAPLKKRPKYLSGLRFELFEEEEGGQLFVRVAFDGEVVKICGEDFCEVDKFEQKITEKLEKCLKLVEGEV